MIKPSTQKGAQIGAWVLDRCIGAGGQAEVWKARHATERHAPAVAIKLCRQADDKARARFSREVELLKRYAHPAIVRLRDHGQQHGSPYFVMDHATTTLERVGASETAGIRVLQESPALLLELFRQSCTGVAHLHANGVLHRDIKPSNILLFLDPPEPMRAALSDLGISSPEAAQGMLTESQEAVGTPAFRAPEASLGRHTKASDVYSLGKTLEYLFTRRIPPGIGPGTCSRDTRMSDVLWDALDAILRKACALDAVQRYQDASELATAIPTVLLTTASTTSNSLLPDGAISLSQDEAQLLNAVIGACPTENESIGVWSLQRRVKIPDYMFSLGLRRLQKIRLVEQVEDFDERGERYYSIRPTPSGIEWALDHHSRTLQSNQPAQVAEDEDIPF